MGIETGFSKAAKKEQTKEIARLKEERFRIIWKKRDCCKRCYWICKDNRLVDYHPADVVPFPAEKIEAHTSKNHIVSTIES